MIWGKIVGAILIFIFLYYKVFLQKAVPIIYQQLWTGFSIFVGCIYLIKGSIMFSIWIKQPKELRQLKFLSFNIKKPKEEDEDEI